MSQDVGGDGVDGPCSDFFVRMWSLLKRSHREKPSMEKLTTIGLDLAKNVFQVHGINTAGKVVVRRQLRRGEVLGFFSKFPPCLVGMDACGTSHYWGRGIAKLG